MDSELAAMRDTIEALRVEVQRVRGELVRQVTDSNVHNPERGRRCGLKMADHNVQNLYRGAARDDRDPEDQYGAAGSGQHDRQGRSTKPKFGRPAAAANGG